jgi:putative phosphoesterase
MTRVGLISDTHGLLRPEARTALTGCDRIVHAGDIGAATILDELAALAPVSAVRGNNDVGAWAEHLPETLCVEVEGILIHVLHDVAQLDVAMQALPIRIVVAGHSHKPLVRERDGVLYVNPGSAGPRRFRLPVTVAHLVVAGGVPSATIIELPVAAPPSRPAKRTTGRRPVVGQ